MDKGKGGVSRQVRKYEESDQTNLEVGQVLGRTVHLSVVVGRVLGLHRQVLDLGRLAEGDSLLLLSLVGKEEGNDEDAGGSGAGDEDTEDGAETLVVEGGLVGLRKDEISVSDLNSTAAREKQNAERGTNGKKKRANNISDGRGCRE